MKHVFSIFAALTLSFATVFGQLLHNPSFECAQPPYPRFTSNYLLDGVDEIKRCIGDYSIVESDYLGWFSPTDASPDYFNLTTEAPNSPKVGVPDNIYDYLNAADGVGYIGLYMIETKQSGQIQFQNKEYVEERLPQTLTPGVYQLSFYISKAWLGTNDPLKSFGACFTNGKFTSYGTPKTDLSTLLSNPHILSTTPITKVPQPDGTDGWTNITGKFVIPENQTADHIVLGHFGNIHNDVGIAVDGTLENYYFIDNMDLTSACLGDDFNYEVQESPSVNGQCCYTITVSPIIMKDYLNQVHYIRIELATTSSFDHILAMKQQSLGTGYFSNSDFTTSFCIDKMPNYHGNLYFRVTMSTVSNSSSLKTECSQVVPFEYVCRGSCQGADANDFDVWFQDEGDCCYSLMVANNSDDNLVDMDYVGIQFSDATSRDLFKTYANLESNKFADLYAADPNTPAGFYYSGDQFNYTVVFNYYDPSVNPSQPTQPLFHTYPAHTTTKVMTICLPQDGEYHVLHFDKVNIHSNPVGCDFPVNSIHCGCGCDIITSFYVYDDANDPCCKILQFTVDPTGDCQPDYIKVGLPDPLGTEIIPKSKWTLSGGVYTAHLCAGAAANQPGHQISIEFDEMGGTTICTQYTPAMFPPGCYPQVPPCSDAFVITCSCTDSPLAGMKCCDFTMNFTQTPHCEVYKIKIYTKRYGTGITFPLNEYTNPTGPGGALLPLTFPKVCPTNCYNWAVEYIYMEFYDASGNILFTRDWAYSDCLPTQKASPGIQGNEINLNSDGTGFAIEKFSVAPNPTNDKITVSYELSESAPVKLEIFSELGQKSFEMDIPKNTSNVNSLEINTSKLSPGKYQIKITAGMEFKTIPLTVIR